MVLRKTFLGAAVLTSAVLLAGCSTLAKMQTAGSVAKMPDGSKIHFNTNLRPSADWGCQVVGQQLTYNWQKMQMEGQIHLRGPIGLLVEKGIAYLTANHLKANYIDVQVPKTHTLGFSDTARETTYTNLNSGQLAILTFYQCQRINPAHHLGVVKSSNIGIGLGEGAGNTGPID